MLDFSMIRPARKNKNPSRVFKKIPEIKLFMKASTKTGSVDSLEMMVNASVKSPKTNYCCSVLGIYSLGI